MGAENLAPAGICTDPYLFLCPDSPGFFLLSLLYNTHNTNIHAPNGIRTRNPSKRAAANPHLRLIGYDPCAIQPVASRYIDWAILANKQTKEKLLMFNAV